MDFDKTPRIASKFLTPDHLAEKVWNLAYEISSHKWGQKKTARTGITRYLQETIGATREFGDREVEPIYNEMTLSFTALKRYIQDDDGDYISPVYVVRSTTAQDITKEEIPLNVLDSVIYDADTEGHPLYDVFESFSEEDTENLDEASKQKLTDSLDEFEIQRLQEVRYEVGKDGEVLDYEMSYAYTLDEDTVHEIAYNSSSDQILWQALKLADGSDGERRPLAVRSLNNDIIDTEMSDFDVSIERFLIDQDIKELTELSKLPKEEHIRRILGMISMISSGLIDLRRS